MYVRESRRIGGSDSKPHRRSVGKKQIIVVVVGAIGVFVVIIFIIVFVFVPVIVFILVIAVVLHAVSYTHLTLPTKRIV